MAITDLHLQTEQDAGISMLQDPWLHSGRAVVGMLRLDRIDPLISGNKWFKLRENLKAARGAGLNRLLSFGGPFSNHLLATAAAAARFGFESVGIVRGLPGNSPLTPYLSRCKALGMRLHFVSRADYDRKEEAAFLAALQQQFGPACIIPEGGANEAGRAGAAAIASYIDNSWTHICVSVGSGTTLAGLRNALPAGRQILGFAPMKGGAYLEREIQKHLLPAQDANWALTDAFHFGGFGKMKPELQQFMDDFQLHYGFALDRVYTAKMMYGLRSLLQDAHFPAGARILCIHTGGLGV